MHCLTAWGQWAVELLQRIPSLPGLLGRGTPSGRRDSNKALPHCLWPVASGTPATHRVTARGQWAVGLLVGDATPAMHYPTDWGQWAGEVLQRTASRSGQWNSCYAPPHCLGAAGSGTPATHHLTA